MKPLTVILPYSPKPFSQKTLLCFSRSDWVEEVFLVSQRPPGQTVPRTRFFGGSIFSHETLCRILEGARTRYVLFMLEDGEVSIEAKGLERLLQAADVTGGGLVYSDFYHEGESGRTIRPLNDYQLGSVRDDFDFGAMILFSTSAIRRALSRYGEIAQVRFAGLYDLRLKVSIDHPVCHLGEPLYSVRKPSGSFGGEKLFAPLDPQNRPIQKEMEAVFTDYLKKIGAYLPPHWLEKLEPTRESFPVEATVIIPVRNRRKTIAEAARSALSQKTDFPFNVIVVDNHSTDGTTEILSALAEQNAHLKHLVPERTDLGIGGCWNEALQNESCGRYAVQLDSDDLYSSPQTLQKMIEMFRHGDYAMVIGSYTLVDEDLKEIPPGLIDHREWTEENGHNNALRMNGFGAPRAFRTDLIRRIPFLNVSYGEDYAAALRICREYRIGRIYESLYLCRRWSGNSDAGLSVEETNRNDAFKDRIRTEEIVARQKMVRERTSSSG